MGMGLRRFFCSGRRLGIKASTGANDTKFQWCPNHRTFLDFFNFKLWPSLSEPIPIALSEEGFFTITARKFVKN